MEHIFEDIIRDFNSLWHVRKRGNTLEVSTPIATTNDRFVTLFITLQNRAFIVTDGGWLYSGEYDCEIPDKKVFQRIVGHYYDCYEMQRLKQNGQTFFFKKTTDRSLLTRLIFDVANFVGSVVSSVGIHLNSDHRVSRFKSQAQHFFQTHVQQEFEFEKELDDTGLRFGAIQRRKSGIILFNFVSGANVNSYKNNLTRSHMNFSIVERRSDVSCMATIVDNSQSGIFGNRYVKEALTFMTETQNERRKVYNWDNREKAISLLSGIA